MSLKCVPPPCLITITSFPTWNPKLSRPRWLNRQMIGWVTVAKPLTSLLPSSLPTQTPSPPLLFPVSPAWGVGGIWGGDNQGQDPLPHWSERLNPRAALQLMRRWKGVKIFTIWQLGLIGSLFLSLLLFFPLWALNAIVIRFLFQLQRLTLAQGPIAAPRAYIGMNERRIAIQGNSETTLSPKNGDIITTLLVIFLALLPPSAHSVEDSSHLLLFQPQLLLAWKGAWKRLVSSWSN